MEQKRETLAHLDSEHYREMAAKLKKVARECRFPGARQEILELARRYERMADHLDPPSTASEERSRPPFQG